ncbi:MAG: ferritin family protein [Dehalococcoidales bacterium]|nr:ferritin family protein [Dehalococcoidales bacterium]
MGIDQDRTLQVLQVAIKMEIDGKQFYLKASRESGNELGRKLLESLAAEEDVHRQNFEKIYDSIRVKQGWPGTDFKPDEGKRLRTVFADAIEKTGTEVDAATTEIDAVKTAMAMENKTGDYYKVQGQAATHDAERNFYQALVAEERAHYLVLLDYYEYLSDPAGWFVRKEHPSLDGG